MRRRIFNLLAALSLLAGIAVAYIWMQSRQLPPRDAVQPLRPTTFPNVAPPGLTIGSRQTVGEAVGLSACVVVGRIERSSDIDFASAGRGYLSEVRFTVLDTLKGRMRRGETVTATALLDLFPEERKESTPVTNAAYIVFIRDAEPPSIVKLIPADQETITEVEHLLQR